MRDFWGNVFYNGSVMLYLDDIKQFLQGPLKSPVITTTLNTTLPEEFLTILTVPEQTPASSFETTLQTLASRLIPISYLFPNLSPLELTSIGLLIGVLMLAGLEYLLYVLEYYRKQPSCKHEDPIREVRYEIVLDWGKLLESVHYFYRSQCGIVEWDAPENPIGSIIAEQRIEKVVCWGCKKYMDVVVDDKKEAEKRYEMSKLVSEKSTSPEDAPIVPNPPVTTPSAKDEPAEAVTPAMNLSDPNPSELERKIFPKGGCPSLFPKTTVPSLENAPKTHRDHKAYMSFTYILAEQETFYEENFKFSTRPPSSNVQEAPIAPSDRRVSCKEDGQTKSHPVENTPQVPTNVDEDKGKQPRRPSPSPDRSRAGRLISSRERCNDQRSRERFSSNSRGSFAGFVDSGTENTTVERARLRRIFQHVPENCNWLPAFYHECIRLWSRTKSEERIVENVKHFIDFNIHGPETRARPLAEEAFGTWMEKVEELSRIDEVAELESEKQNEVAGDGVAREDVKEVVEINETNPTQEQEADQAEHWEDISLLSEDEEMIEVGSDEEWNDVADELEGVGLVPKGGER